MKKLFILLLLPAIGYCQSTDAALTTEANIIKNETAAKANNATRVGTMFNDIISSKLNVLNLNNPLYMNSGNLDLKWTAPLFLNSGVLSVSNFNSSNSGIVGASGGGTTNFLRADGTWTVPAGTLPSGSSNGQILYYNGSAAAWSSSNNFKWDNSNNRFILGDGNGAGVVADASIGNMKSYFSTSDNTIFHINGYFQSDQTAATTHSIQALEGYTRVTHSTGITALALGTIGNIELSSTGAITEARSINAGGNLTGTGTISQWNILWAGIANSGGGVISTGVGLYVNTWPSNVTTKYNIYTADNTGIQYLSGSTVYPPIDLGSVGTSQNDYNIGTGTVYKINATAAISITGMQQGLEGRVVYMVNTGSSTITFPDNSSSSSISNRFSISGGFTLAALNTCQFVYLNSAWHLAAKTN